MAYVKTVWQNGSAPALNADNLNKIENELESQDEQLSDLKSAIEQGGNGWTEDQKQNLLALLRNLLYINDIKEYYDAFETSLYPPANLSYISAVYTQGTVTDADTLDSLRGDLVVTAHYSDATSEEITNYTLSGVLSVGTSTITVSFGGKTTTFNVTVSSSVNIISYELGGISSEDGTDTDTANRLRTDFIPIANGERFVLTNSTIRILCRIYDSNKQFVSAVSTWATEWTASSDGFVRFVIKNSNDSAVDANQLDGDTILTTSTYYVLGRNAYPIQNLYIYNGKGVSGTEISDNANRALTEAISDISWLTSPMYTARYTDDTDGQYIFKFVDSNNAINSNFTSGTKPKTTTYFGISNNNPVMMTTTNGGNTASSVPNDAVKLRLLFANNNTSQPFSTVPTGILVINNRQYKLVEGNSDDFV